MARKPVPNKYRKPGSRPSTRIAQKDKQRAFTEIIDRKLRQATSRHKNPEMSKRIYKLNVVEEMSFEQISVETGIEIARVKRIIENIDRYFEKIRNKK